MLYSSQYFSIKEFASKDGDKFGTVETDIAADLVHCLHTIRAKLQVPFLITSGARSAAQNIAAGGKARSTHLAGVAGDCTPGYEGKCRAVDVSTSGWTPALKGEAVCMALALGMRVGISANFIHFDVENAPYYSEGLWNYASGESSGD